MISPERVLDLAAGLLSEDGENPEYDRGVVELTADLLGYTQDEYADVRRVLAGRFS